MELLKVPVASDSEQAWRYIQYRLELIIFYIYSLEHLQGTKKERNNNRTDRNAGSKVIEITFRYKYYVYRLLPCQFISLASRIHRHDQSITIYRHSITEMHR